MKLLELPSEGRSGASSGLSSVNKPARTGVVARSPTGADGGDRTPVQLKIRNETLLFIRSYFDDHGYPPTSVECGARFGICQRAGWDRFNQLAAEGYLHRTKKRGRGMFITTVGLKVLSTLGGRYIPVVKCRECGISKVRGVGLCPCDRAAIVRSNIETHTNPHQRKQKNGH